MQTLARLFGRSPFAPLQTHMEKVAFCVKEIIPLFEALEKKDYPLVEKIAKRISELEHEADLTKNEIRNNLPTGLFLPISKGSLLEILSLQDNLADRTEDAALLLTFRDLEMRAEFAEEFRLFLHKNLETFDAVFAITKEMDELLESSFGGKEAEKVRKMVEKVAKLEHACDVVQRDLLRKMFCEEDALSPPLFFLWMKVIQELGSLSDESEKLANRIRMILEVK